MPPHRDTLDGPVVATARKAPESGHLQLVLPAFELAMKARALGSEAGKVADTWFLETAVRLHRAGEGAAFTGLKPADLDVGPVIPAAESALESGSSAPLAEVLCGIVREEIERRHARAIEAQARADEGLPAAREYVGSALGLQEWAHGAYRQATTDPHPHHAAGAHGDEDS